MTVWALDKFLLPFVTKKHISFNHKMYPTDRSVDRLNEHKFKLSNKCSNQPIHHDLAFKISADINKKSGHVVDILCIKVVIHTIVGHRMHRMTAESKW